MSNVEAKFQTWLLPLAQPSSFAGRCATVQYWLLPAEATGSSAAPGVAPARCWTMLLRTDDVGSGLFFSRKLGNAGLKTFYQVRATESQLLLSNDAPRYHLTKGGACSCALFVPPCLFGTRQASRVDQSFFQLYQYSRHTRAWERDGPPSHSAELTP